MLNIDRSARVSVAAGADRCRALLADVESYPSWASLIASAELVGERVRLRAELLGVAFVMDCILEVRSDGAVLRRMPHDDDDHERYEATWTVTSEGAGSSIELHVVAAIDAPGPARLVRGRIERRLVDDLVDDFARST